MSLAKLAADCKILVIDEHGRHRRACEAAFHELIAELAERGLAILLILWDLQRWSRSPTGSAGDARAPAISDVDDAHHYASMSQRLIRLGPRRTRRRRQRPPHESGSLRKGNEST